MKKDIDYWVKYVQHLLREADALRKEGQPELADALRLFAFDDVPTQIVEEVRKRVKERQQG